MELIQRALLTALGALSLIYALVKFSLGYWKRRGILHEKPKLLWGNLKGVISGKRHVMEALQVIYEAYKGRAPFVGFYACLKPFVLVLDLELMQHILGKDAGSFTTRGMYYNLKGEPLSGNLLQLDGHKWRALHAQVVQVFTPANMDKMLPRLVEISQKSQRELCQQGELQNLNISHLVEGYNIEVIACMAFGLDLAADKQEFRLQANSYGRNFSLWRAYLALEFPLLARILQYKSYDEAALAYFLKLTRQQLEQQRRRDRQPLQTFLQLFTRLDQPLSELQIAAQAFGFLLAGLTPLNATLSFCLYELALKPELQELTRQEIQQVLERHSGKLSKEALKELKFSKQVLYETLRLHSPYPFLLRRATKDFELPKSVFVIAKGNNVLIPTAALHRDPAIYKDPLRFDPSRFNGLDQRLPFLPFGLGLRGCLASQFVEQHLLVGLVALLKQHRYSPCAQTLIPLKYDTGRLLLMPKTDIHLSVERLVS